MNSPAALPDGGTPGITSRVDGAAVTGSQVSALAEAVPSVVVPVVPSVVVPVVPVVPVVASVVVLAEEPSDTSATTRPMLVCTSMATTLDPLATEDRDSVTVWCGGTVMPVSLLPAWDCPASVMTVTSTLAASESTFIMLTEIFDTPFCFPGPTNHRSEPGAPQRTAAMPVLSANSASMDWAIEPLPVTDQPWATGPPFFPVVVPAGSVSSETTPGLCARTGLAGRSVWPAGGSAVRSMWLPWPGAPAAPARPPSRVTGAEPPPGAGGQARAAEVTATCLVAVAEAAGRGAAGWSSWATPPMAASATRTAAAGTRWLALISRHRLAGGAAACRAWPRAGRRARAGTPRGRGRGRRGGPVGRAAGRGSG